MPDDVVTETPTPTPTMSETPVSFPSVPSGGMELGDIGSSMAHANLGPFEVHDVIGRGGMGIVFSGIHVEQRVPVAVKVITRRGASHPRFRQTMHNEVRAVAGLDHPGVVRVLDYGEIPESAELATDGALRGGSPYFVMEMVPHGTLIDYVGRVDWQQARAMLLSLLDALAHSHAREVIHRDIKPGNILLDDWGGKLIPRLADFGLAFATGSPTDASRSIGTPQYMAPEQIETPWRKHGPWSDLYSLGCVAFELLCGRKLFQGASIVQIFRQHLDGVRRPLRSLVRPPEGFDDWLERMLHRNPQDRFRSAAEAARALAFLDDSDVPDVRPPECSGAEFATVTPSLGTDLRGVDELLDRDFEWPKRYPTSMRLVGAGLGIYGLREIPLAGRREELSLLWETLRNAIANGPQTVVVRGAHGIGKTKLVRSFSHRLGELGIAMELWATHAPDGGTEHGLPGMIARHVRAIGATRAEAGGVVREYMSSLGIDDPCQWRATTALIEPALGHDEAPIREDFEFASSAQRYDVALNYLRTHADRQPVVVIVDDAHYGADALDFVRHALERESKSPVVFVIVVADEELARRAEEREIVRRLDRSESRQLVLEPLDEVSHLRLVEDLLLVGGEVAIGVADRTAGNPGFAVGLMGEWVRNGQLHVGETGFVLEDDALDQVPDSVQDVWQRSLADVLEARPQSARMAFELGAALGATVRVDEWVGVCQLADVEIDWSAFEALLQRRLVRRTDAGWSFVHPLVVEALKQSAVSADRWARWKRLCAEHLESMQRSGGPELLERAGAAWLEAEEFERAVSPLEKSAALQQQRGNYRDAERLSTGVVRALKKLGDTDRELADAYLFRAASYSGAAQPDEMIRWAKKALELGEENGWTGVVVEASGRIALGKQWLGEADAADWVERAYSLVEELDEEFLSDDLLALLGYLLTSMGRFDEASQILELDRRLAERADNDDGLAKNAYQMCRLGILSRDYSLALKYGEEALLLYEQIGQLPAIAGVKNMLAEVYRKSGDHARAEAMYRDVIALQRSVGHPTGISRVNLAQILLQEEEFAAAEEAFLEAAAELRAAGRRRLVTVCRAGLLGCAASRGEWNAANRLIPEIESFVESTEEAEVDLAELLERAGDAMDMAGQWADAARVFALALSQWRLLGDEERAGAVAATLSRIGAGAK